VPGTPSASPVGSIQTLFNIDQQTQDKDARYLSSNEETSKRPNQNNVMLTPPSRKVLQKNVNDLPTELNKHHTPTYMPRLSTTQQNRSNSEDNHDKFNTGSSAEQSLLKLQKNKHTKPTVAKNTSPTNSKIYVTTPQDNSNDRDIDVSNQKNASTIAIETAEITSPPSAKISKSSLTNSLNHKDFNSSNSNSLGPDRLEDGNSFLSILADESDKHTSHFVANDQADSVTTQKTPLSAQVTVLKDDSRDESRVVVRRRGRPPKHKTETKQQNVIVSTVII